MDIMRLQLFLFVEAAQMEPLIVLARQHTTVLQTLDRINNATLVIILALHVIIMINIA